MKRNLQVVTGGFLFLALAGCNKAPVTTIADSVNKPVEESQPQPVPAPQPPTTIPTGTKLRVSLIDAVYSDKNRAGDRFAASLAEPVVIDGRTILSKGTKVYGRVVEAKGSGRVKGRASVELQLTAIVLADRRSLDISTNTYTAVAPGTKKRDAAIIGGGAGLGAAIGAIAGGGKGALIGAAVGGGAGTGTVLATKGKEIHYQPETRLQFTLASPIEI